jgi:NADPH:quinone reductase-like Zn-dependent oxidoreductase
MFMSATTTRPETMNAVSQDRYGSADTLHVGSRPVPPVTGQDVLVRVHAAGIDRGVIHLMNGLPYPVRLAGYGLRKPKNPVPGMDLAGVVVAVGDEVTQFRTGDEVFGIGKGSFAEYALAPQRKLVRKPAGSSWAEAAAVSISGLTALQAIRDQVHVRPGDKVLVIGASGGVGTYAVQIAKTFGAEVTGVCSGTKADLVTSLGADHVIDYTAEDFTRHDEQYDAMVDIGGNRPLRDLRRVLTPRGRLVIVGGENGGRWLGGTDRQLRALLLNPFVSQELRAFVSAESGEDIATLARMLEDGSLTPVIDSTYPLSDAAQAVNHVAQGRARGKVVVTV